MLKLKSEAEELSFILDRILANVYFEIDNPPDYFGSYASSDVKLLISNSSNSYVV